MTWWVSEYARAGAYVELLSQIFWVLLSISLHELGHGWMALRQGDDTPLRLRRMTLNPFVHMGPHSLLIFALCGIAWGAMPVNPARFRDGRRGDVLVSVAGPAVNVLLALGCVVLLAVWVRAAPGDGDMMRNVATFLYVGLVFNLILAPLNLLPIPPLDGSHVLAAISSRARALFEHPQAPLFGLFAFIAIFFMTPIGGLLFSAAHRGAAALVALAGG